ncbi:RimK family alpha-L-glutamate ligase [bacterium]|nr:RimK family alpha-L-glutamate ligase [bacterium]
MKLAIIGMNPYYESDRILYEALKKGHEAVYLSKRRIVETNFFNDGNFGVYFTVPKVDEQMNSEANFPDNRPLVLNPDSSFNPTKVTKGILGSKKTPIKDLFDITYFDAFLFREVSKTLEWSTILANFLLSHNKTLVDEKIGSEMYYKSKHGTFYKTSLDHYPYAKTFTITSKTSLYTMLEHISYPFIVKRSESSKGKGVYKVESKQELFSLLEDENLKVGDLLFQEFIQYSGDIRVFVVGQKILGAMRREPKAGQWKGNVAQGADAYPVEISDEVKKLALDVVKLQNAELRGVDIMLPNSGPVLIETNSAPQFRGFEAATGVNVGKEIVEYIEQKYAKLSNT